MPRPVRKRGHAGEHATVGVHQAGEKELRQVPVDESGMRDARAAWEFLPDLDRRVLQPLFKHRPAGAAHGIPVRLLHATQHGGAFRCLPTPRCTSYLETTPQYRDGVKPIPVGATSPNPQRSP